MSSMQPAGRTRHFTNIQALRAVAALSVVLFHLAPMETMYFGSHWVPAYFAHYGMAGVDLFFVISGFVMVHVSAGRFANRRAAFVFLYRRLLRIYPVYWFYLAALFGVLLLLPTRVDVKALANQDLVVSFLLLPVRNELVIPQAWTLTFELSFYAAFAAMIAVIKERYLPAALGVWAALVVAANALSPTNPYAALLSSPFVLEFIAGAAAAISMHNLGAKAGWTALGVGAIAFCVPAVLNSPLLEEQAGSWRIALFGVPAFCLVLGAALVERHDSFRAPGWLRALGDASYSLYLGHGLVMAFVARTLVRLGGHQFAFVGVVACVAVTIGISLLSYRYLERPLLAIGRQLTRRSGTEMPRTRGA